MIRVQPNGDVLIPASVVIAVLESANRSEADTDNDIADFGAGSLLFVSHCGSDSGTEITLARDRRKEAKA